MPERNVELGEFAREPQAGDVVTWDGQEWAPNQPLTRRGVIGLRGLAEWLRVTHGMEGPDIEIDQAGLTIGRGGDTVLVYEGTYNEAVTIQFKAITLAGENREKTVIDGGGSSRVLDTIGPGMDINNFSIRNCGTGATSAGVYFTGDCNSVRDCFFENCISPL